LILAANHVSKLEFLCGFREAFFASMTEKNIQGGFAGAGLVPYDPERVICKLDVKLRTPTPLNSRAGTPQPWVFQTPHNPREATSQRRSGTEGVSHCTRKRTSFSLIRPLNLSWKVG
jgi:hypothetical protein